MKKRFNAPQKICHFRRKQKIKSRKEHILDAAICVCTAWLWFAYLIFVFFLSFLYDGKNGWVWVCKCKCNTQTENFALNGCVFNTQQIGCTFDESIRNGSMTFFTASNQHFFLLSISCAKDRETPEKRRRSQMPTNRQKNHFSSAAVSSTLNICSMFKTIWWREDIPVRAYPEYLMPFIANGSGSSNIISPIRVNDWLNEWKRSVAMNSANTLVPFHFYKLH